MLTAQQAMELAVQHHREGRLAEAEGLYRQILAQYPDHAPALHALAYLALQTDKPQIAEELVRRAIRANPKAHDCFNTLGAALQIQGRTAEAIEAFRTSITLKPDYAPAAAHLAHALLQAGQMNSAIDAFRNALHLQPDAADLHYKLGFALYLHGDLDDAIAQFKIAITLNPQHKDAHNNLAAACKDQGMLDESVEHYRQAMAIAPDDASEHSNLLWTLHFHPEYDAQKLFEEHRAWNQRHAEPLKRFIRPHENDCDPERPLRVGYVSPNFMAHPVGRFLLPLLEHHDKRAVESFCYSDVTSPDEITAQIRSAATIWRDAVGLTHEQLAEQVREDRIDVLVDLTMHMSDNRLLVFARKPAPVQVTYLAYCSTTGLDAMDYRVTDPYLDPPGQNDAFYSERSVYLPTTYWCYRPSAELPEGELPALAAGHVTFGSLNNFSKVSVAALTAWRRILAQVPGSRLILHAQPGAHRERVQEFFAAEGIDASRIEFVRYVSPADYFREYQRIDIALDTFPYAGGTTTCDALWMGVPVVSLAGERAISRSGLGLLSNAGLPELVATSEAGYVQTAIARASDLHRLKELRQSLRTRLRGSPLMDEPRFAADMEGLYRSIWRRWCGGAG